MEHLEIVIKDYIREMIADASTLNAEQFNRYLGCIYCYTPRNHENHRHLNPCEEPNVARNAEDFRRDVISDYRKTRRERLKSAPYPRLKKRKVFRIVEGGTLWAFGKSSLLQNIKKMKERPFGEIEKKLKFSKKTKNENF